MEEFTERVQLDIEATCCQRVPCILKWPFRFEQEGRCDLQSGKAWPKGVIHSIEIRSKQHKHLILVELRHVESIICLHCDRLIKRQTELLRFALGGIVVAGFLSWL